MLLWLAGPGRNHPTPSSLRLSTSQPRCLTNPDPNATSFAAICRRLGGDPDSLTQLRVCDATAAELGLRGLPCQYDGRQLCSHGEAFDDFMDGGPWDGKFCDHRLAGVLVPNEGS